MDWLARPLAADGVMVAEPLDPSRLADGDLQSICQRMHAILNTVEMLRCEGRLLPVELFDAIDTLADRMRHGPLPRLEEWSSVISDFGSHYGLNESGPINVEAVCWEQAITLVGALEGERNSAPDDA